MTAGNVPLIDPRTRRVVGGYADPTPARVIGAGRQTAIVTERDQHGLQAILVDQAGDEYRIEFAGSFGDCTCGGRSPRHTCAHLRHVYGRHIRDQKTGGGPDAGA